jgi:hypothetical protein
MILRNVNNTKFMAITIWSDKPTFKLKCTVNCFNSVYWSHENFHIHMDVEVNLPELKSVLSKVISDPFFLEETVTSSTSQSHPLCLPYARCMEIRNSTINKNRHPRFYCDARTYLNANFPDHWTGQKGANEYPSHSHVLVLLTFICGAT